MKFFMAVVAHIVVMSAAFSQQELSLTATKDNTLYEDASGSTSNGAGEFLFTGKTNSGSIRRGLILFDLSGRIPSNATILSVKVRLNMSKTATTAKTVSLHKVTASWGEGTSNAGANEGGGAASTTNDATWIHRFFNTATWATPGGDFVVTPSASLSIGGVGSYQFESTPQLVADVQEWVNDSTKNHGWIIIGDESATQTAKRFDSRENPTAANRPTLIVQYSIINSVNTHSPKLVEFSLQQNYPNPFNPSTIIRYSVPSAGPVSLKVFDLLGKEVATLVNEVKEAGFFAQEWNASGIPSGMYLYRLQAGHYTATKKLILIK